MAGIVSNLQKLAYLFRAWIRLINDGDVNVAHSRSLNCRLLLFPGIVGQINYGFDSKRREALKVLLLAGRRDKNSRPFVQSY